MPSCVVFPGSTEEVSSVLRVAGDLGTPVIPRGAGTNLSAGTVAHRGEVMLVLTRMKRLLELDAENLAAVCQPGCRRRSSEPPPSSEACSARAHRAFDEIFAAALELGGTITGEHGVGLAKLPWLERAVGAEHIALLWRIKAAFDPQGILNPGKLRS